MLKKKLLWTFLPLSLLPLIGAAFLSFSFARTALTHQVLNHLESVAAIQKDRVESFVDWNQRLLASVAHRPDLHETLERYLSDPSPGLLSNLNRLLESAKLPGGVVQTISVVSREGRVVASSDPHPAGAAQPFAGTVSKKKDSSTLDVIPLPNNHLTAYLYNPIVKNGRPLGWLAIEENFDELLARVGNLAGLGRTGEITLAERNALGQIVFLTPSRFIARQPRNGRVPRDPGPALLGAFNSSHQLMTETVDYHGTPVLAATYHLPSVDWALVVKMDKAEALASVTHLGHIFLAFFLILSIVVLLAVALVARSIVAPIQKLTAVAQRIRDGDLTPRGDVSSKDETGILAQALNQMTDNLLTANNALEDKVRDRTSELARSEAAFRDQATILSSILTNTVEGILVTDDQGRFILFNPSAERMMDMTLGGGSLDDWAKRFDCYLSDKTTLYPPDQLPLARAMRGEVIDSTEIFLRTSKTPEGRWLDVSARPWRDENAVLKGGVALLRDITAQKSSDERFLQTAALVEFSDDAIVGETLDGIITSWNKGAEHIYGYADDDIVGRSVVMLIPPEELNEFPDLLSRVRRGEHVNHYETVRVRKDGQRIHVSLTVSPIKDLTGKITGASTIARDISDQKNIEEAMRESNLFLDSVVENIPNMVFVKDAQNLKFVRMNRAGEELLGYTREELTGKNDYDFFPRDEADFFTAKDRAVFESGWMLDVPEETIHTRNKGTRILHTKKIPILDDNGNPQFLLGISDDITDRIQAERSLVESEGKWRSLLQNAPAYVITVNLNGTVTFVNRNFPGGPQKEIVGAPIESLPLPEHRSALIAALERVRRTGQNASCEMAVPAPNGEVAWYACRVGAIHHGGEISSLLIFSSDITEQKKAEETLLANQRELARTTAEREQLELFAYVAGHDLQEPLHKIIAFGDLLNAHTAKTIDEKALDYLNRMQNAAKRMRRLIEDLLKFSRLSTKEETFEPIDLNNVVKDVLLDLELRIGESKARIDVADLPTIHGSPIQMRELFQNLISNALKFHKPDEAPYIRLKSRSVDGNTVEISIKDDGIGFDEKFLERIFRPFERLNRRGEFEGSGIGLAICQKIVFRHGGKIFARSAVGKGSTFIIKLPKGQATPADQAPLKNTDSFSLVRP